MAINAELFDGTILEFPDGTDPSVIQATAKRVTLERQMSQGEPRRDDLGEVQPQGSAAYEAISKATDFIRPYAEPAVDYVTEQAGLLAGTAQKGYANLKMAVKQSQVAGLMELQEARKAKYGTFDNMPPEEQQNYVKAQKVIDEKLGEVAGLGLEKKAIEKEYGVRGTTKAFNELSQTKEYQEGSFLDKMGMIGKGLAKDPIGIITDIGVESMPQSLAVAATAVAARTGQLNPKIAATLGGSSSAMMEFGNTYAQLREEGLDHKEAWEKAGVKSGIIGFFDAASFYSAGKAAGDIINNIQKGAVKETIKDVAKETGKQGALGAGGEGAGSFAIGQEIDPLELTKEAVGEIFGAPGEAISTYQSKVAEARAVGQPDPVPPKEVRDLMESKGFTFKRPEKPAVDEFAGAPQVDITGIGQTADLEPELPQRTPTGEVLSESQDLEAMLAEIEDEKSIDKQLKQVSVLPSAPQAPAVELTQAEEKKAPTASIKVEPISQADFTAKLQNPEISGELQAMANNAGWAQVGGRLLRENIDDNTSPVIGRTQWIPKEPWWAGRPKGVNEAMTRNAVRKALAGEKLTKPETRMLEYMVSVAEENMVRADEERARIAESDRKLEQFEQERRTEEAKDIADKLARMGQQGPAQAILQAINAGQPVTPAAIEFLRAKFQEFSQPAPMELVGQTPEEARAEQEALEKQRAEQERVASEQQRIEREARERDEIARRSVGAAEEFQLGQTAEENLTGQKDIFAEPEVKAEKAAYTPPKLYQDNPGGDWLKGKKEQSIEAGKNKFGNPSRFGSVTGSFKGRNVLVPVNVLASLKGINAEQENVREKDLEAIKKVMDETGRLPQHDGVDYVPFINVYQDGTAYVNEGNHRIMAAKALGFKYLPVEIFYYNGGEQVATGDLPPKDVISYDMQANDDKITLDNYRGEKKVEKPKTMKALAGKTEQLNQELKDMPRENMNEFERELMDIADKIETYGEDGSGFRAAVKSGRIKSEKNLEFYRKREQEYAARAGKAKEPVSETKSMEDFAEGYERDVARLRQAKGLFATETSDMLDRSNEYIQKLTDRMNQLGYKVLDVTTAEPMHLQQLRSKMSDIGGSTSRLLKQSEALEKGYARADEEKYRQSVNELLKDYEEADELLESTPKGIESKEDQDWDIPFNLERKFLQPSAYVVEETRTPSLRVKLKQLIKQFNDGRMAPETFTMRVEGALEETKSKAEPKKRIRGADIIREKLLAAKRRGELSEEAVNLAEWFILKNPALVDDLAISIKAPKEGQASSGYYNPMSRIFTLMKHSSNDETAVHEMLHHMERMMPEAIQNGIRKSWFTSLSKAAKSAAKSGNKDLQKYYESLIEYHVNGDKPALKTAQKLLEDGDIDYEHYQHMNASEFWAVNAADIVAGRYAQSKSIVGKLKTWLRELGQKLKSLFGLQSSAPILRALDSLAKADGRFVNDVMIASATDYLNRKNYKGGQAPLSAWQDPKDSKLDTFIYKIQDKLVDTKRVQQAIEQQVGEIEDAWNVYMKEELYHGRTAKRTQDFLKNELLPIIKSLAKAKIDVNEFDQFLHNRHAEERNIQIAKINPNMPDSGSGISTADARQYMADLDPVKRQLMEKLADKIDAMVKETQKILVENGLEEQSTIDAWNGAYKHYVPLKREDVDFVHTGTGLGQGFATRGGTSARATGSLKDVADIFVNLALQRERAIIRAEKSKVGKALYGLAIKNPNPDFWLPVNPDAVKNPTKMIQELIDMGMDPLDAKNLIQEPRQQYIDPRTGLVAWRVNPVLRSSDNVFPVRINGQDRFIFFNSSDPRAMRMVSALKNLDADQLDIVLSTIGNVTRWLASVNTQYNPVFGAWNFLRDIQGAALNLTTTKIAGSEKKVLAGVLPALRGIYADLRSEGKEGGKWADLWEDFQKEGGQTGYRDQFAKNRRQANIIEREMKVAKRGLTKRALFGIAQWLSDYNDSMENAVRLSAYKVALDQGLSKQQAASLAKNLTVNFNRKGQWSQTVGALYAFFNASVQGTTRLLETMTGPKGRKIAAGGFALGTLQALALAAAGFDDDEPPEFIKSRNFIIPTGDGGYVMIPMPLGFNMLPNTGRMLTEFVLSGGKNPGKKVVDFMSMTFDSFNPVGGSGLQLLSPTIADPIAALYTNKDAFGRPIYKEDRATAPTPGYTRSRENATTLNKYVAEFLNYASGGTKYQKGYLSPTGDQLDYLVGQFTGGVGREIMKGVGTVKAMTTGEELPTYKIPVAGKIYGNTESPANISSKFYENVTQLANYENEIKGRQKNGESVGEFFAEHPEARLYQRANQLENEVSKLNKMKKELIERNAPQERIELIEKRKTQLMDNFNKQYKDSIR